MDKLHFDGPIVLAILDGVGLGTRISGNAVLQAHTEFLDLARSKYLNIPLEASGEAVGILAGSMGNSEVGHNAIGAGQIVKQGISQVEDAFNSGNIWQSPTWQNISQNVLNHNSALHFAGIFSDGKVHSSIDHLERMITKAYEQGIKKIRIHLMLDGRDVAPQSEPKYINRLENFLKQFVDVDYKIASGGGRMVVVADRYQSDWYMVELGWNMMVHGAAPSQFHSAAEAIEFFRAKDAEIQDQYIPPFVIVDENSQPVGKVLDHDSFIYYDFRADRAIEIAMAFTYNDFPYFDRGHRPDVCFAGMTEYNSDTHVPALTLVPPVHIENPLNRYLGSKNISQLAVSETVKFGHITYYFNGNSYEKAPGEDHIEIPSDSNNEFHLRPWMKSAEIADAIIDNLNKYKFIRANFPGGDMVGHFADMESTIIAMESIDLALRRIAKKVDELGGMLIITADHGNAEEISDSTGAPKTSHTLNKVPCIFYDNTANRDKYHSAGLADAGLTNLAATIATLLGEGEDLPASWRSPLILC